MISLRLATTSLASLASTLALGVASFTLAMPAHAAVAPVLAPAPVASSFVVDADADVPTVRVGYVDLNLDSAPGRATLARRIDRAASAVCRDAAGMNDPMQAPTIFARCRTAARTAANARLASVLADHRLARR